jgi:hypothetical protein
MNSGALAGVVAGALPVLLAVGVFEAVSCCFLLLLHTHTDTPTR